MGASFRVILTLILPDTPRCLATCRKLQVTGSRLAGEDGWQATSGGQEGREEDDMEEKKIGKAQKGYPNYS